MIIKGVVEKRRLQWIWSASLTLEWCHLNPLALSDDCSLYFGPFRNTNFPEGISLTVCHSMPSFPLEWAAVDLVACAVFIVPCRTGDSASACPKVIEFITTTTLSQPVGKLPYCPSGLVSSLQPVCRLEIHPSANGNSTANYRFLVFCFVFSSPQRGENQPNTWPFQGHQYKAQ